MFGNMLLHIFPEGNSATNDGKKWLGSVFIMYFYNYFFAFSITVLVMLFVCECIILWETVDSECEIWGSHGSEYRKCYLLLCDGTVVKFRYVEIKRPTRCNRWFFIAKTYCSLNMFQAPLCPSSGAQEYYTDGCCWWYLVLWFTGCIPQTGHTTYSSTPDQQPVNQSTKYHRQQPPL
jgi:hypothetical protein